MVRVFSFRGWDQILGHMVVGKPKATAEFIERHGLERIEESGEDVDPARVDSEGRLRDDGDRAS